MSVPRVSSAAAVALHNGTRGDTEVGAQAAHRVVRSADMHSAGLRLIDDDVAECGLQQSGIGNSGHCVLWGVRASGSLSCARRCGQRVDRCVCVTGTVDAMATASSRGSGIGRRGGWGGVAGLRMRVGPSGTAIVRRGRGRRGCGFDVHARRPGDQPGSTCGHRGGVSRCPQDGSCSVGGVSADRGDHGLGMVTLGPHGVDHPPTTHVGHSDPITLGGLR